MKTSLRLLISWTGSVNVGIDCGMFGRVIGLETRTALCSNPLSPVSQCHQQ